MNLNNVMKILRSSTENQRWWGYVDSRSDELQVKS